MHRVVVLFCRSCIFSGVHRLFKSPRLVRRRRLGHFVASYNDGGFFRSSSARNYERLSTDSRNTRYFLPRFIILLHEIDRTDEIL